MNRFARPTRTLALVALAALLATSLAQGMNHGAPHAPGVARPGVASATAPVGPMGMGMGTGTGTGTGMGMATQTVDEASFLVHMVPHHAEAVASADALRAVTTRPELLELLDAVVTSQTAEIAQMEGWLDAWHPDAERDVDYMPMMRDLGPDASVADRERAFLEDMIGHHMMAIRDAQTLLAGCLAEHDDVAALARSIVADQMGEIQQMTAWLSDWFDVAAPMGMGMGAGGMGMGANAMGMGGMPGMGAFGMGMGAMHGTDGHGFGAGQHGAAHSAAHGAMHGGSMHGGATGASVGATEAARLALAFVAGRTDGAATAQVVGTTTVVEVAVQVGDEEWLLRVDARTGEVSLTSDR